MRISDWSSDVCSSDLPARVTLSHAIAMISGIGMRAVLPMSPYAVALSVVVALCLILFLDALHPPALANAGFAYSAHPTVSELLQLTAATVAVLAICAVCLSRWTERTGRSEEHTSELTSLMRISYAVFCLKKKNRNKTTVLKQQSI